MYEDGSEEHAWKRSFRSLTTLKEVLSASGRSERNRICRRNGKDIQAADDDA